MRPERFSKTLKVITRITETQLFTSPSLQADFSYNLRDVAWFIYSLALHTKVVFLCDDYLASQNLLVHQLKSSLQNFRSKREPGAMLTSVGA